MKKNIFLIFLALSVTFVGYLSVRFYSYLFALDVSGEVIAIDRVTQPSTIISNSDSAVTNAQLFSFAVAIRDQQKNEIYTASSEDRQWAIVQKGQCAEARFFRHPPWNLQKSGTFFNARLTKLYDCQAMPK